MEKVETIYASNPLQIPETIRRVADTIDSSSKNRLARQCEAGEVPIASELGDAAYLWPKAYESASALDRGHV